jgi:hypothetical protein
MNQKYRKKPVVIEAVEWTGSNLREVIDFTGLNSSAEKWTWEEYEQVVKKDGLKIFTLEGPLIAAVSDYIIKGVNGEFYPCKPDIFAKTYESASTAPQPESSDREIAHRLCDALEVASLRAIGLKKENLTNEQLELYRKRRVLEVEAWLGVIADHDATIRADERRKAADVRTALHHLYADVLCDKEISVPDRLYHHVLNAAAILGES